MTTAPSGLRSGASARSMSWRSRRARSSPDRGELDRDTLRPQIRVAPARARLEIGVQVELHLGLRPHHGTGIPPLEDHPAARRRAHAAAASSYPSPAPSVVKRDVSSLISGVRISPVTSCPSTSTRSPASSTRVRSSNRPEGCRSSAVDARCAHRPGEGPIEGAGIDAAGSPSSPRRARRPPSTSPPPPAHRW